MDQLHSGLYLARDSDLRRYQLAINRLRVVALDPERSNTLISQAAEKLWMSRHSGPRYLRWLHSSWRNRTAD